MDFGDTGQLSFRDYGKYIRRQKVLLKNSHEIYTDIPQYLVDNLYKE